MPCCRQADRGRSGGDRELRQVPAGHGAGAHRSEAELATGLDTPIDASEIHNADLAAQLLEQLELDAVVVTASGCGTMIKDYARLLRDDPELGATASKIAALARDVSEVIDELGLAGAAGAGTPPPSLPVVAYQACPHCGDPRRPHRVCPSCGHYAGKQRIEVEEV